MQTRTLISLIKQEAPSWSRELIRALVDDIHYMMMAHPLQQTRIINTATGKDPIFSTTAGTYQYRANSTVMTNFPSSTEACYISEVYTGTIGDSDYDKVDVLLTQGDQSNAALVSFKEDPGTSTSSYSIRCYKKPINISSESIELEVPISWHLRGVYEGVMGWIEKTDNGKSERWFKFEADTLSKFWYEMNKGTGQQKARYDGGY